MLLSIAFASFGEAGSRHAGATPLPLRSSTCWPASPAPSPRSACCSRPGMPAARGEALLVPAFIAFGWLALGEIRAKASRMPCSDRCASAPPAPGCATGTAAARRRETSAARPDGTADADARRRPAPGARRPAARRRAQPDACTPASRPRWSAPAAPARPPCSSRSPAGSATMMPAGFTSDGVAAARRRPPRAVASLAARCGGARRYGARQSFRARTPPTRMLQALAAVELDAAHRNGGRARRLDQPGHAVARRGAAAQPRARAALRRAAAAARRADRAPRFRAGPAHPRTRAAPPRRTASSSIRATNDQAAQDAVQIAL